MLLRAVPGALGLANTSGTSAVRAGAKEACWSLSPGSGVLPARGPAKTSPTLARHARGPDGHTREKKARRRKMPLSSMPPRVVRGALGREDTSQTSAIHAVAKEACWSPNQPGSVPPARGGARISPTLAPHARGPDGPTRRKDEGLRKEPHEHVRTSAAVVHARG